MRHVALGFCLLIAPLTRAQGAEATLSYAIPGDAFQTPSRKEQAAILAGICEGKVEGDTCDTCPESSPGGNSFTLNRVILGPFLEPNSRDAFATISGCEEMHGSIGWGFLLTTRSGEWEAVGEVLGLELGHCHRMTFRSGRDFLVCEDYRMESFQLMHSVTAVFAEGDSIRFRNLLTAADTTRLCDQQTRVQKAQIDKVEFRDQNGDGIEDASLTVSFGTLADSERRRRLCQEVEDRKSSVHRPEPSAMKTYRIDYRFDGRRFTLTKESEAAAKLFRWEN